MTQQNWSRNISFGAARVHAPTLPFEVQKIVAAATKARTVGSAHSFNDLVSTSADLISLERMDQIHVIDGQNQSVSVEGGIRYHWLAKALDDHGLALANLASVPHFSVVGACATATHGSGDHNQALATSIASVDLVTAAGDLVTVDRSTPGGHLAAIAVGLGAFGVITAVTLDTEPRYLMAQELFLELPLADAIDGLDEIMASAYSVSYFLDWQTDRVQQVWRKHRIDDGPAPAPLAEYFGGVRAVGQHSPRGRTGGERFTDQSLSPRSWAEILPHVHPDRSTIPGSEFQTEYFVPRRFGQEALRTVAALGPQLRDVIRTSEIRTVAADELWLSPFDEPSLAVHFSWKPENLAAVEAVLPRIESALEPFEPKPHWGKLHAIPPEKIRSRYPRFDEWAALVAAYDPDGCFRNAHLDRLLG